jgi:hypothetical protein
MRDGLLATERVRAIHEELAGFLLDEVMHQPENTINTILDNRDCNRNYIVYMHERVPLCDMFDQERLKRLVRSLYS